MPTTSKGDRADAARPTCFIAMPVATRKAEAERYGDSDHWLHVLESLFIPAVDAAGFEAIRPQAKGSHLIHAAIIRHLSEATLVLCDLSGHNPNVFFELGVRTSLNLPIALVRDEQTDLPFDTSGINTHTYSSTLRGWDIETERSNLHRHLEESASSCSGQNPLWRQFGLAIRAQEPDTQGSPLEAKVDLLTDRLMTLQALVDDRHLPHSSASESGLRAAHYELMYPVHPGDSTPAQRFVEALDHLLSNQGLRGDITVRSPYDVRVQLIGGWSPRDLNHVRALARKHDVALTLVPPLIDWPADTESLSEARLVEPDARRRASPE